MLTLHHSLHDNITALRQRFPETPFLALGQTVFWDEPLKSAFCRALEETVPRATMIAGVHNTDYFAKLSGDYNGSSPFLLLPHNDGSTRDLWSAAGEISALFGSETIPSRQKFTASGVAFDRLARRDTQSSAAFLDEKTAAWGWRALVQTGNKSRIADDVRLRDIYPALREQLQWAFDASLQILGQTQNASAHQILDWLDEFYANNPDANLTACYQFFIPRLWALTRGSESCPLDTTSTTELLRFNKSTFARPRFALVNLFLDPLTRELARRCYDEAVAFTSGIYQLNQFGEGALPFDVVIPGEGRGTLRVHNHNVIIETETPRILCNGCDLQSVEDLAGILESTFGDNVTLVGKAVTLISMLSAEYIFVFHEKASSYTMSTAKMNQKLRAAGVDLPLHPVLRLRYSTWDALGAADATFTLPKHLADAFAQSNISAGDFANRWQEVCATQDQMRQELAAIHAPRDLLKWLTAQSGDWNEPLADYDVKRGAMNTLLAQIDEHKKDVIDKRNEARQIIEQSIALERTQGEYWRAHLLPLKRHIEDIYESAFKRQKEQASRKLSKSERQAENELRRQEAGQITALKSTFDDLQKEHQAMTTQTSALREAARQLRRAASIAVKKRAEIEKSTVMSQLRTALRQIEDNAETERLRRVRNAILTSEGLRYTNYRPTAWWLSLVSPDQKWFEAIVASTEARLEEL